MSAISFLAGMGAGYIKAKDKALENERQAARDKREQEAHDATMDAYRQTKANQAELKAVGSEQQTPSYTPDQGQQLDAVANAKDAQGNPYYAVGSDASGKYTVTPNFQDETGAKPAPYSPATIAAKGVNYLGKNYNTPLSDEQVSGARRTRMADLAAQGNTLAGTALTNDMQRESSQLTIDKSKQEIADKALKKRIDGLKTPEEMAAFMTESPADKAGGEFKAQARYAADRKTFTFDKVNPDGTFTPTGQVFENSAQGMDKARMTLAGFMTPEQRIQQYQFEETKAEQARHNKATEGTAKQNADTNEQYRKDLIAERRAMTAARIAAGGAGNGEGAAEAAAFNPLSGFDGKKAQAVAFEQAAAATNTDGKPLSPQAQGQLAQKIYRSMEDSFSSENTARERARVFKGAARTASTPDEINAVRERAKKSGYTDAEMALLDPRFKSVAAPKVPATKAQATNVVPAGATTQSVTAPPKYSYQAQMAEAEKTRLAKQAALREAEAVAQANEIAQEKLIEEKRKAFLASRGTDTGRANLSNTTVNLLR